MKKKSKKRFKDRKCSFVLSIAMHFAYFSASVPNSSRSYVLCPAPCPARFSTALAKLLTRSIPIRRKVYFSARYRLFVFCFVLFSAEYRALIPIKYELPREALRFSWQFALYIRLTDRFYVVEIEDGYEDKRGKAGIEASVVENESAVHARG